MRHIDEFTMHRFRGIRDLKLEGLGQINLLVGNNNSGKTSVLEALSIFCDPVDARTWLDVASMRVVLVGPHSGLIDQIMWLFPQGKDNKGIISPEILFSASGGFPLKEVSAKYERFSEIDSNRGAGYKEYEGIKVLVSTLMMSGKKDSSIHTYYDNRPTIINDEFFPDINSSYTRSFRSIPTQIINVVSHRLSGLSPRLWSGVVEADLKLETIELLRFFDPDIQDVDIISPTEQRSMISVKHKKLGRVPLGAFGDGLRRMFTLASAIPTVKEGLLLVDELETAIHTRALEKAFDWLVKTCVQNNVQLFATTHSLETVDAVLDAGGGDVDLVTYRLQNGEDQTTAKRFNKKLLARLRENLGQEVRW